MALSSGALAAILGALGVGGFLLWKKAQATEAPSQCEKMLKAGAALAGYPTADALTKSVCSGVNSLLDDGLAGVSKLPGVQVATATLGAVTHAVFGNGPQCPAGSRTVPWRIALEKVPGIATTNRGLHIYSVCIDAKASVSTFTAKDIRGIFYGSTDKDAVYVPYVDWSSSGSGLAVRPVAFPSAIAGTTSTTLAGDIVSVKRRTTGGVTVT